MPKWERMADEVADKRLGLVGALLARLRGVAPRGLASIYRDCDLETLKILGCVRLTGTTVDWPQICGDVFSKRLVDFYRDANPAYAKLTRRVPLRNFLPTTLLRPGELVPRRKAEGGHIVEGSIADGGETIRLLTFAVNFSVSSQVFANDDVAWINQQIQSAADGAALAENDHFFTTLASNPVLSDGVAFFHASHGGNLLSGAAVSATNLGLALAVLRKQTGPGGAALNLAGRYLVVGPDNEVLAKTAVAAITAGGAAPALETLVDSHLAGEWYVFVDPNVRAAFVAGRLRDSTGPDLDVLRRFEIDGVAWRVTTRLGVGAFDWRAAVKNPGV